MPQHSSHSSPSPSSPDNHEPPPKRRRQRTERACRNCVRSKTRCEEFVPGEGCFRCRRRRDRCSFLDGTPERQTQTPTWSINGTVLGPGSGSVHAAHAHGHAHLAYAATPAPPSVGVPSTPLSHIQLPPDILAKLQTVTELSDRVARLENALILAQSPTTAATGSTMMGPPPTTSSTPALTALRPRPPRSHPLWASDDPIVFDERLFSTTDEGGYPDAVAAGIITREQVDIAFQMFKHRLALLMPLHPLTLATTRTPEHPFVVLAMLLHVPALAPPVLHLQHLIDRSVLHAMTGAVSVQVVLALLVLSIAPLPRGADAAEAEQAEREGQAEASSSTIPLHITPLRAIGMAYEMGASLGLEERTKAAITRRENWGEGWYSERVSEALLWEMVKSRHTIVTMMTARASPSLLPPSNVRILPTDSHLSDSIRETIRHLTIGDELITLVRESFERVAVMEAQGIDSVPEGFDVAEPTWRDAFKQLESFLHAQSGSNARMIVYDAYAMQSALVIRVTTCYQQLPSVISPSLKMPGLVIGGGVFVRTSAQLLDLAHSLRNSKDKDKFPLVPANLLIILAVIVIGAERTNWFVKQHHRDQGRPPLDESHIANAHEWLQSASPQLAHMVDSACRKRMGPGWMRDPSSTPEEGAGPGAGVTHVGVGMFTGDLSAIWDSLAGLSDDWLNLDFAAGSSAV